MKRIMNAGAIALALVLAGCSQTAGSPTAASAGEKPAARVATRQPAAAGKKDACEQAMQAQTNAAMLGSALGMVGGLGGLGGRGGAIAGQVASTAGSMVAQSQSASASAQVMRECS